MRINLVGAFIRNKPFGTEIAFQKGFERLGSHLVNVIDTSYPGQVWDYEADFTMVFKWMEAYWMDLQLCKGKKIVYQPDDARYPHIQEMMRKMRVYCDYALTFDPHGAEVAEGLGYKRAQRLLLTADDELYRHLPGVEKDIDVCFVGSLTGGGNHRSRAKMCQLASTIPGIKTYFNGSLYNMEDMVKIYNRSKVIINHATDVGQNFGMGYGYQCRHFEAGFTKACLLSNHVADEDRTVLKNYMDFFNEGDFVDRLKGLLASRQIREGLAEDFYQELVTAHKPEHRAQEILDFVRSL